MFTSSKKVARQLIRFTKRLLGKLFPDYKAKILFHKYASLASKQGIDQLYVILSFDCDTKDDIPASDHLFSWLSERGIKSTFAVPGVQLLEGATVYRRIADQGADFINHGALPHAEWREGRYWPATFYNEMPSAAVIEDVRQGHEICLQVLGKKPAGFRAPHFGYFQRADQREVIYGVLRELGYFYSTSTLPDFGLRFGPIFDVGGGIFEIPLSGSYANPSTILDSWDNIESPYHPVIKPSYAEAFIQTIRHLMTLKVPCVLNYYVDPAHVWKSPDFYRAMDFLKENNTPTLFFWELLKLIK